ncbi:MAG: lipocalin family protein [Bacteroidota bacterium]
MRYLALLPVFLLLFTACEGPYQSESLVGSWQSIAWRNTTTGTERTTPVHFQFGADERYVATYGAQEEQGRYWIEQENLHTIEDGKAEKKVRIAKLQNDTLIFEMNRAGNLEELVLVKQ